MDYIRQLGPLVLDHRFRRITESLLRSAEEIYAARGLPFRGRWASTYSLLYKEGPLAIGQIAARLRLTHPAVIGITDEMAQADLVSAVRDPADHRRRVVALTPAAVKMSGELSHLWKEFGDAQRERFAQAGCDIMKILERVEDSFVERPLSAEVLAKIGKQSRRAGVARGRVRRTAVRLLIALALPTVYVGSARAQVERNAADTHIDAATRARVINALSDSVIDGYIYEATSRRIADSLRHELASGAYDRLADGNDFAKRINETLRRIGNDKHLGVQFMPPVTAGGGPVRVRQVPGAGGSTSHSGRRVVRVPGIAGGPEPRMIAHGPTRPRPVSRVIAAPDYGFAWAAILEGNIGYLDLVGFSAKPQALELADSVMALFADAKAIIIDVGKNHGGGPQLIQKLSAYLFDKRVHLVSSFMRGMDKPTERWTAESVSGKRLPTTPVYLLTSRTTVSAAESFALGLRIHDRVTILGERTAGGGHFGSFVGLGDGYTVFLPQGRTYDPSTNEGWEAEGLKPDVMVTYARALDSALALARRR